MEANAEDVREIIIIGPDPAGLTAAVYAAAANLNPLIIEGVEAGRPADAHHRGRELPRLPRRHHGSGADGADARAGRAASGPSSSSDDVDRGRLLQAAVHATVGEEHVPGRAVDHRDGRIGDAGSGSTARSGSGPRRLGVRHLRRLLLPRARTGRRRRRRHGDGRGDLPHQVRHQGHGRPPPRQAARLQDHAGPRLATTRRSSSSGTRSVDEVLGDDKVVEGVKLKNVKTGDEQRLHDATGSSSPSATRRTPVSSRASSN